MPSSAYTKSAIRKSRYPSKRLRQVKNSKTLHGESTLASQEIITFVENFFFLTFIQDDDEVFELTYNKRVSRKLSENLDDHSLRFEGFKRAIEDIRRTFADRRIIDQTVLISPTDSADRVTAGHTAQLLGTLDGREVVVSVVAVGTAVISSGGEAQLEIERLVVAVGEPEM